MPYPALLITISMDPNFARPWANAAWMSEVMETSHFMMSSWDEGVDATRSSSADGLRSVATTLSPRFSAASVTARPIPEDDPVTVVFSLDIYRGRLKDF